jgi:hypothetical protein
MTLACIAQKSLEICERCRLPPSTNANMRAGSGCLRHGAPVSRAPPFAFAGVLARAALGGLATALALAFVFAFAGVFTLLRVVQRLSGNSRLSLNAGGIGA